jgi:hypothetical protein
MLYSNIIRRLSIVSIAVLFFTACSESEKEAYEIIIQQDSEEFVYKLPYQSLITSQDTKERVWKEADIWLVRQLSEGMFNPVRIIQDKASTFVLDASDGYIKQLDHESETVTRIGQGKGNGPGEFTFPFDFDVDPLGNFIVMDIAKRALITLDSNGEPLSTYQFKSASPTTLSVINEKLAVVMINGSVEGNSSASDGLFQMYNRETNELQLFNDFLTGMENLPPLSGLEIAFTGTLLNDLGSLLFLPKNINHIIRVTKDGEIAFVKNTIDQAGLPVVHSSVNGASLSSESFSTSLDGFLIGNNMAIWSKTGIDKHGGHVIDFYDQLTGDYKYSINIPELGAISGLAMGPKIISTINADGSVSVWQYDVL